VLIINLLRTMNTYNNVHVACLKHEIMVWGWELVSGAWLGVP